MRPLDFYRLGLSLAQTADSEAAQRTAVNRLYYGLHHEACCRYFRTGADLQPLNASRRHAQLRNRYGNADHEESKAVGHLLDQLMAFRRAADYELSPPFRIEEEWLSAEQLLERAVATARQLLAALEAYSPGEAEEGCACLVQF